MGKTLHEFQIPGMAVAEVQVAEVIYAKGFGVKKLGREDPVATATIFRIGSTSKAFTSALVASVVEEGRADWKDRVVMHLPCFAMEAPLGHQGVPGQGSDGPAQRYEALRR